MDDDLTAAKSMFGIVFLLMVVGIVILIGGALGEWPFLVRLLLGISIIIGGAVIGCWYIRRI